ncbi:MAG: PQQ-dependent sugar dehydrogenase, partial [Ilumatobacteraceae bacterium]
ASGDAAYTVPADNPFVGVDGARPEIWSIGLRNPWRFSFDRSTGDLWIADVGQNQWEEVDVAWAADGAGRGSNFGWSAMEGNHPYNADQSTEGITAPIHEYEHVGQDCSISGSALYRGVAIPELVGWYVFADYCSGQVRALKIADRAEVKQVSLGRASNITGVSEGPDGELFVLSGDGQIYAVTPG